MIALFIIGSILFVGGVIFAVIFCGNEKGIVTGGACALVGLCLWMVCFHCADEANKQNTLAQVQTISASDKESLEDAAIKEQKECQAATDKEAADQKLNTILSLDKSLTAIGFKNGNSAKCLYLSANGVSYPLMYDSDDDTSLPADIMQIAVRDSLRDEKPSVIKMSKVDDKIVVITKIFWDGGWGTSLQSECSESAFCDLLTAVSGIKVKPDEYEFVPSENGYVVILTGNTTHLRTIDEVKSEMQQYIAAGKPIPEALLTEYNGLSENTDARTLADVQEEMSEYLARGEAIPDTLFEEYNRLLNRAGITESVTSGGS